MNVSLGFALKKSMQYLYLITLPNIIVIAVERVRTILLPTVLKLSHLNYRTLPVLPGRHSIPQVGVLSGVYVDAII